MYDIFYNDGKARIFASRGTELSSALLESRCCALSILEQQFMQTFDSDYVSPYIAMPIAEGGSNMLLQYHHDFQQ